MRNNKILSTSINGQRVYSTTQNPKKKYPSVTSILSIIHKPALVRWEANLRVNEIKKLVLQNRNVMENEEQVNILFSKAEENSKVIKSSYSVYGTQVHEMIHCLIKNETKDWDPTLENPKKGFYKWLSSQHPSFCFVHSELSLISSEYGYGGTIDAIAQVKIEDKPQLLILDWKTGNNIYPEYAWQLGAYYQAFKENFNEPIEGAYIVQLNKKEPNFQSYRITDLQGAFESFRRLLSVWELLNQEEKNLFHALEGQEEEVKKKD